jgi:serine/threonine protein kinase
LYDFVPTLHRLRTAGAIPTKTIEQYRLPREIARDAVQKLVKVGNGAFGEVWKGLLEESVGGEHIPAYLVAIKTVIVNGDTEGVANATEDLAAEATLMSQVISHPHIVSLIGVVSDEPPLMVLVSYCEYGSLLGVLKGSVMPQHKDDITEKHRLTMLREVARGMIHLGNCHIVHRDLAARNVLVDSSVQCKVADFGLSRGAHATETSGIYVYNSKENVFAIRWTAVEAMRFASYSVASDVWSWSILGVEIFGDGSLPYPGVKNAHLGAAVDAGLRPIRPTSCRPEVFAMLQTCWAEDPAARPTFEELEATIEEIITGHHGYEYLQVLGSNASVPASTEEPGFQYEIPNVENANAKDPEPVVSTTMAPFDCEGGYQMPIGVANLQLLGGEKAHYACASASLRATGVVGGSIVVQQLEDMEYQAFSVPFDADGILSGKDLQLKGVEGSCSKG